MEALAQDFAAKVEGAGSLDEIEALLLSRPDVASAQRSDYLLKSYPPQRMILVEIQQSDGSTLRKEVVFFELGDGRFQFREMRDSATR